MRHARRIGAGDAPRDIFAGVRAFEQAARRGLSHTFGLTPKALTPTVAPIHGRAGERQESGAARGEDK